MHNRGLVNYPFTDTLHAQSTYVLYHSDTILPFPTLPNRLKMQSLQAIKFMLPSSPDNAPLAPIYKVLPVLNHVFATNLPVYFHPPSTTNQCCFNVAIARDFALFKNRHAACNTSFSAESRNLTGVLDNSANVHVLKDYSLFISSIEPCPIGVNVGTVVGSTPPEGVGTA